MLSTIFTSVIALAASVSALTPANTANPPEGNPIGHPELGELIPAGEQFEITWTPTDPSDKISLVLLRGPSENVKPILTIVEAIDNSGSFVWDVPSDLEPDTTHYGIELIVEGSGTYQFSPQCGVSNPGFTGEGSDDSGIESNASGPTTTSTLVQPSMSATGTGNYSIPVVSPTKSISKPASMETRTSTYDGGSGATTSAPSPPSPTEASASSLPTGAAVKERMSLGGLAVVGLVAALIL